MKNAMHVLKMLYKTSNVAPVLYYCVVIFVWSYSITDRMLFTFESRVPLMRLGRQWCGIFHYHSWTGSIEPRLLFSYADFSIFSWVSFPFTKINLLWLHVWANDRTPKKAFHNHNIHTVCSYFRGSGTTSWPLN